MLATSPVDGMIMAGLGVFFTLQGYELICFGKKPDALDTQRLAKWRKAQALYRYVGPIMLIAGLALWLIEPRM